MTTEQLYRQWKAIAVATRRAYEALENNENDENLGRAAILGEADTRLWVQYLSAAGLPAYTPNPSRG